MPLEIDIKRDMSTVKRDMTKQHDGRRRQAAEARARKAIAELVDQGYTVTIKRDDKVPGVYGPGRMNP